MNFEETPKSSRLLPMQKCTYLPTHTHMPRSTPTYHTHTLAHIFA